MSLQSRCHQTCCHLQALLWLEHQLLRWCPHLAVKLVLMLVAVFTSSLGCWSVFKTWGLALSMIWERRHRSCPAFDNFVLKSYAITSMSTVRNEWLTGPHSKGEKWDPTFWREECQRICGCLLKIFYLIEKCKFLSHTDLLNQNLWVSSTAICLHKPSSWFYSG